MFTIYNKNLYLKVMEEKNALVLIAEDDLDDQELLREAFLQVAPQCKILFYRDGEFLTDAIETNESLCCACLILLDLNMPRKGGLEALEELKQNPKCSKVPIVIFSTSRNADDSSKCLSSGANAFITKPSSYDDLVLTVKDIVARWLQSQTRTK
jgi:CheY-like chemotaxis protein